MAFHGPTARDADAVATLGLAHIPALPPAFYFCGESWGRVGPGGGGGIKAGID